jgi:SAM-dependent methyltransferase
LAEAGSLSGIGDQTYDFVLACHVLEHVANPLRALQEWKRVLVPGGAILVMVPDKRRSFDHKRPVTSFEHIEADFQANTREDDLTHLDEVLALHDLNLDRGAGSPQEFRERCFQNRHFRAMHHHVFDPELLRLMFVRLGMKALVTCFEGPCHIVGFAEKAKQGVESFPSQSTSN